MHIVALRHSELTNGVRGALDSFRLAMDDLSGLTLVSLLCQLAQPLKCRRGCSKIEGLAVARHHQGTAPGQFDPAGSISELRMSTRAIFTINFINISPEVEITGICMNMPGIELFALISRAWNCERVGMLGFLLALLTRSEIKF